MTSSQVRNNPRTIGTPAVPHSAKVQAMSRRKLTARFVASVKVDSPRMEIRDADEEGLELRVTKRGVKTWAFRYRRKSDGRKRLLTLGRYPTVILEEARILAQEERAKVSRGADPATGAQERKDAPTFRELVAGWQSQPCRSESN